MYKVITSPAPSLIWLFIICLLLSLLLFLTVRLVTSYSRIRVENNKISIEYILLGKVNTYTMAMVTAVEEVKINTFQNKEYRQLIISLGVENISLNNQVYTGYDLLKQYLNQKKTGSQSKNRRN